MMDALNGATAMASFGIAAFFIRFWRASRDPFHLWFAGAFFLLAAQRCLLIALEQPTEANPALYVPRAAAYLLIICGIVQKNLSRGT